MGAIYLVNDNRLSGKVWAIKEMSLREGISVKERDEISQAFIREANLLSSLNHPNIPRIVDFFSEHQKYYLVMDFVAGKTLADLLEAQNKPFTEAKILPWAKQLCQVFLYLHNHTPPIIFRDMKPSNVMIDEYDTVKLIDFGIARLFQVGRPRDTMLLGTPGFAPPEQYGGRGQTDARSDIYALGVTLYQLVTNQDLVTLTTFRFEPVRKYNPRISPPMENVVMRAIEPNPAQRWQTAKEMLHALETISPFPSPPIPQLAPAPNFRRVPAVHSVNANKELVKIPLQCTLPKAMEDVFWETRQQLVDQVVELIRQDYPNKKAIALYGHQAVGTSWVIVKGVQERLKSQRVQIVYLNFDLDHAQPDEFLPSIFRDFVRAGNKLPRKIRNRAKYILNGHAPSKIGIEWLSRKMTLDFPVEIMLPGISINHRPLIFTWEGQKKQPERPLSATTDGAKADNKTIKEQLEILRDVIDYLTGEDVKVVLVIDKLETVELLDTVSRFLLKPFLSVERMTTIVIVNKSQYDEWPITKRDLFTPLYVPCMWDFSDQLFDRLIGSGPQADNRAVFELRKHLRFMGQGKPGQTLQELRPYYHYPLADSSLWRRIWLYLQDANSIKPHLHIDNVAQTRITHTAKFQQKIEGFQETYQTIADSLPIVNRDETLLCVYKMGEKLFNQAQRGDPSTKKDIDELFNNWVGLLGKGTLKTLKEQLTSFLQDEGLLVKTARGYDSTAIFNQDHSREK